jgi:hypothetical protein
VTKECSPTLKARPLTATKRLLTIETLSSIGGEGVPALALLSLGLAHTLAFVRKPYSGAFARAVHHGGP